MSQPVESTAPGRIDGSTPAPGAQAGSDLVDRIAVVAAAVPGVAALGGGLGTQVATYLPGRRVNGVADRGDRVEIALTAAPSGNLHELAARVQVAVGLLDPRPADVVIADLADPAEPPLAGTPLRRPTPVPAVRPLG